MKKTLLLSASLIALSVPAFAADMPLKAPVRIAAPLWTGLYVGVHGGYGWGNTEWDSDPFGNGGGNQFAGFGINQGFTHDNDGWMAGGHMGYNWQIASVVLGIEGSATWADLKGSSLNPYAAGISPVVPNATYTNNLEWLATITPRFGVVLNNNWLAYVKGGLAVAQVSTDLVRGAPGTIASFSRNAPQMGWTVGAGVEYMLAPGWILGVEYNYYNLMQSDLGGMVIPDSTFPIGFSEQMSISSVLARVSYKFNDNAPISAYAAAPGAAIASGWSGFYIGANAGYAFGDADRLYVPGGNGTSGADGFSPRATGAPVGVDVDGLLVGLHAGGNVTWGNVLLGIEAAATFSDVGGSSISNFTTVGSTASYKTDIDWMASVTPRLGYTFGNALGYVKGGLAVADVRSRSANNVQPVTFAGDQTRLGWTAGVGVEYAWSQNWIVGLEYNYYNFDRVTLGGVTIPVQNRWPVQYDEKIDFSAVTARLSYKFGG